MARYEHLPIYKSTFDLLVYIETIAKNFSRYHKYTHGTDLRKLALDAVMLVVKANNVADRLSILEELRLKLEELKVVLRVCKEVKAFPNFNSFETSVNRVVDIAKQNEGWVRSLSRSVETKPESRTDAQRGQGRE